MKRVKSLEWTPGTLAAFWDYCSTAPGPRKEYFASRYAQGIANFVVNVTSLRGKRVLDYGCGPGDLVAELLARGASVTASDCSPDSVAAIQERYAGTSGWEGAVLTGGELIPLDDGAFDIACCIETIEHILDDRLDIVLSELFRVVRPSGIVLLTTPNEEDLELGQVFCPKCRHEFHRWQHVRSWNSTKLSGALARHGFAVAFCRPIHFARFQGPALRVSWKEWSPRMLAAGMRQKADRVMDAICPRSFPEQRSFLRKVRMPGCCHLVAVAEKLKT